MMDANKAGALLEWWNRQPPVGKNKPFLVKCNGKVMCGFDTDEEAMKARDSGAYVPIGTKKDAPCHNYTWTVERK